PMTIVFSYEEASMVAKYGLARRGIKVPDELADTGFDDGPVARHLHPPLTTVRQPIKELGLTAFEVLYARMGTARGQHEVVLPVQLIIRDTCGCAHSPALPQASASVAGGGPSRCGPSLAGWACTCSP